MRQHWRCAVRRPESAAARTCVRLCARTPTRIEPQRSFKMAAPRGRPMVRLQQGPQILGRATAPLAWPASAEPSGELRRARAAGAANPSHRESRTWHLRSERSRSTLRGCPFDEFAAGALGLSAQCATLRRFRPPAAWAWQPMLPNPAAPPHNRPEQAASGRVQLSDK